MSLRDLGISPAQEVLYRTLLLEPTLDLEGLADRCGSDPAAVRADLDQLGDLALTFPDAVAPCGVAARRPGVALGRLAERRTLELSGRLRAIADTQAAIVALDELALGSDASPGRVTSEPLEAVPGFEVLRGRLAISARLDELAYQSRLSADSITPGPPRGSAVLGTGLSVGRSVNRGVRFRWLVEEGMLGIRSNADAVRDGIEAGAHVRVSPYLSSRLVIADASVALLPIEADDRNAGALVISHPAVVEALRALFEQTWRYAAPMTLVDGNLQVSPVAGAAEERDLIAALADSSTDESAARHAGISERQFRRRLAAVMTALGAKNRFQAGVLAERHGLLDAEPPA